MNLKPFARLALIYLIFSVGWILLSDTLVSKLAHNNLNLVDTLQNYKGIFFVCLSSILLFTVSRKIYGDLEKTIGEKDLILEKLQALHRVTGLAIVEYNFSRNLAVVNENMRDYLNGNDLEKNFYRKHNNNIHPDDRNRVKTEFSSFINSSEHGWQIQYKYGHKSGEYKTVINRGYLLRCHKTGKPETIIFTIQDVSDFMKLSTDYYLQKIQFRQSLTQKMIETQELERQRWAQELHDDVCQVLTVAKLYLENGKAGETNRHMSEKAKILVENSLNKIRQLSASIRPPTFTDTPLLQNLEDLIATINRFQNLNVHVDVDPEIEFRLTNEHKLMVYRIVQEQFNNIIKYAAAEKVEFKLKVAQDKVLINISDNGTGFNPSNAKAGIGLKNIKSRLQAFSGDFEINSSPGKGCQLNAHFSLN